MALLAFRIRAAEQQVLDVLRIDAAALDQRAHGEGGEIIRAHLGQRAFAGEMEGCADVTGNDDVVHNNAPW